MEDSDCNTLFSLHDYNPSEKQTHTIPALPTEFHESHKQQYLFLAENKTVKLRSAM